MARDNARENLHPLFLAHMQHLLDSLGVEGIPLALYEGARSPFRQAELYARGRGVGPTGATVTRAKAWQSFHQYGVAGDFVFKTPAGGWTWDEPKPGMWKRYTELARAAGFRTLDFERPHIELPLSLQELQAGRYPAGGSDAWQAWLENQIETWGQHSRDVGGITHPAAPPLMIDRPPLVA